MLRPLPPGRRVAAATEPRQKEMRYLDIYEDDPLDETLVASWIRQALELPGKNCV